MCVIIVKPYGVKISDETLRLCAKANPDGGGMCYRNDKGSVTINKGYFNFPNMLTKIREIGNREMIIHFRIRTSGKTDAANCHPFPISKQIKRLRATDITTKFAVAHNGILSIETGKKLSDTQEYIRQVLASPTIKSNLGDNTLMSLIDRDIGSSRLAIMSHEQTWRLGDGWKERKGSWFSNLSWQYTYSYSPYYPNYSRGIYDEDEWDKYTPFNNPSELLRRVRLEKTPVWHQTCSYCGKYKLKTYELKYGLEYTELICEDCICDNDDFLDAEDFDLPEVRFTDATTKDIEEATDEE